MALEGSELVLHEPGGPVRLGRWPMPAPRPPPEAPSWARTAALCLATPFAVVLDAAGIVLLAPVLIFVVPFVVGAHC